MNDDTWLDTDAAAKDRWLLSYADLVTLLLAFFVVMYSVSAVNEAKLSELASTLSESFDPSKSVESQTPNLATPETTVAELSSLLGVDINIVRTSGDNAIRISMPGELLFSSGTAELSDLGILQLQKLMPTLERVTDQIVVEGHTDNQPIATAQFPSNWELSAQRAARVARQLEVWGVTAKLKATGLSDTQPVTSNDTVEGRGLNRRVVFYVNGIDWSELSQVTSSTSLIEADTTPLEDPRVLDTEEDILDINDVDPDLLEQVLRQLEAEGN